MPDSFSSTADAVSAPARRALAVSPHDSNPLTDIPKALYVGTGGDINLKGQPPVIFPPFFGDTKVAGAGAPGAGPFGGPGAAPIVNPSTLPTNGVDADANTGGGGSGGFTAYQSGSAAGGKGGSGLVVVLEFA